MMRTKFHAGRRVAAATFVLVLAATALAHRPVLEQQLRPGGTWESAAELVDPTHASVAVYGSLSEPSQVDFYRFVAGKAETIPAEALAPVRPSNERFRPTLVLMGRNLASAGDSPALPFAPPEGYHALVLPAPETRAFFHEPHSREYLYRGAEARVQLEAGETYYVAIYEPERRTGTYALSLGTVEQFEDVSKLGVVWNVFLVKMGLGGGPRVPWLDLSGAFLALVGLAAGLGASALSLLFELSGGAARAGWLRAQKTALMVGGAGLALAALGSALLYRVSGLSGVALFQTATALLLVAVHLYLSIRVGLRIRQRGNDNPVGDILAATPTKLLASHALALACWSVLLFLFAWYALMLR